MVIGEKELANNLKYPVSAVSSTNNTFVMTIQKNDFKKCNILIIHIS